jgi:hypothetical protein
MANYVVIGAGASGLYTAFRLLTGGKLQQGDTVQVYEAGNRPGGRIFTYAFPPPMGQHGLYAEFGGMRFAVDGKFPTQIVEGHVLVQNMIVELGLQHLVRPFIESNVVASNPYSGRMYYLRGTNVYENSLSTPQSLAQLPYRFSAEFMSFVQSVQNKVPTPYTSDNLLGAIATAFAPNLGSSNKDRTAWCTYFASGAVAPGSGTPVFPAGTKVQNIGYWNLLYDQFGDEGFDYAADGAGYTSNVINWNSADAMQANNDYGSDTSYARLDGGYGQLFTKLSAAIQFLASRYPGSGIFYNQTAQSLTELPNGQTSCVFSSNRSQQVVAADHLFLAMPRKSLELIAQGCLPAYMLNQSRVQYFIQSSIDQPAMKIVMVFDSPWWSSASGLCRHSPFLTNPQPSKNPPVPPGQWVGGPTITDLPLRQIYYFANNIPGGPGVSSGPYVLLASYDDENYSDFWRVLEVTQDLSEAPSRIDQPLHGPTEVPVDSPMTNMLMKQLADAHGANAAQLPAPLAVYYQDWGQNPYGGGYHGWAAHYNICQAMDLIRAPYKQILNNNQHRTYIIGSCYSFDQAWVEGAFCTAESVLQEFLHLAPFRGVKLYDPAYWLVCKSNP